MPLPAIIPAIASMLAWVGIDLGISWIFQDGTEVAYISGLGFADFIGLYWLQLLLYLLLICSSIYLAIPKHKNNGWEGRDKSSL